MTTKVPALVIGTVSLAAVPQVIEKHFAGFSKRMIYPNSVRDFEVIDEDSCNIARLKIKEVLGLRGEIDEARVELKEPVNYVANLIQAESKKFFSDLDITKDILTKKITDYKNLEEARLRMGEEKKKEELQKDIDRKKKILDRISSITLQLRSLLVGGEIVLANGEKKLINPPTTPEEVERIKQSVTKSFPDFLSFQEYRNQISEIYEKFVSDVDKLKKYIATDNFDAIRDLRKEYNSICNIAEEQSTIIIEKEEKKAEKEIQQEIKDVSKGIRNFLQFFVLNQMEVPETFKIIDNRLVNSYIDKNKESIMESIKQGKGCDIIPGIEFKIEKRYVSR